MSLLAEQKQVSRAVCQLRQLLGSKQGPFELHSPAGRLWLVCRSLYSLMSSTLAGHG